MRGRRIKQLVVIAGLVLASAACTTVNVAKVSATGNPIDRVCIEKNAKVLVGDFLSVVERGFMRHGIRTEVFEGGRPDGCEYVLTYTAFRSWDLAPYMDRAELRLARDGTTIGTASYRHAGGFGFNKWAGTASKMNPVIDELLSEY